VICKLDEVLEQKGLTKGWVQKMSGVGNLAKISEGADLRLSGALKICAVLECEISDIWPNTFGLAKKEIVTEQLVMVDASEQSSESVFAG